MAKKKKKSGDVFGSIKTEVPEVENVSKSLSAFNKYLAGRDIPLIDDGVVIKKMSSDNPEAVEAFYQSKKISRFVHMEKITRDGRSFTTNRIQFEFGNMLDGYSANSDEYGMNPIITELSFATMAKKSFINNIDNALRYINYFIEYFDDDDELMHSYFQIMFNIMHDDIELDPQSFVEMVFAAMTTDTMIQKVIAMVEHNTDSNLIKKTDRTYDESVQLTLEHLKAIMGVSCFHKMLIPVVGHYYNTRENLLEKNGFTPKELYYYAFAAMTPVLDEHYGIDLYSKLYHTATTRITKTANSESKMWMRRKRHGITPMSFSNKLMKDLTIDISQKAAFNMSAIVFIHVCFDKAIRNELIQADKWEFVDINVEVSDSVNEHISKFDQWQTSKTFHSQKDRLRAQVSIKESLERMGRDVGIDFPRMESSSVKDIEATMALRDEYAYYQMNLPQPLNDTQLYIIQLYYANKLGSADDVKNMEVPDLLKLIMVMKRDFAARNFNHLQYFISSHMDVAAGKKYNRRRIEKLIMAHSLYEEWISSYEHTLELLNREKIYNELKTIVACPIRIVDYELVDYRGGTLTPSEVSVVDEIMRLLTQL